MKANLARFTVALSLLATMALYPRRGSQVVLSHEHHVRGRHLRPPYRRRRDPARRPVIAGAESEPGRSRPVGATQRGAALSGRSFVIPGWCGPGWMWDFRASATGRAVPDTAGEPRRGSIAAPRSRWRQPRQTRHPRHSTRPPRSRRRRGDGLVAPRWLTPAVRVRAFTRASSLGRDRPATSTSSASPDRRCRRPFPIPWPLAALAFYLGETNVVEVHFLRERHSFSLSELPGIVGLFFLRPNDYLLACLVGTGFALLADRDQSSVKRAFNLAQFGLAAVVALCVFHAIATPAIAARSAGVAGGVRRRPARRAPSRRPSSRPRSRCPVGRSQFRQLPADAELQRDGRDGQREPGDPGGHGPVGRSALDRPAGRPDRHRVRRLSRLHRRAREARAPRAALRIEPAAALRARARLRRSAALLDHARRMFRAERAELLLFPDPHARCGPAQLVRRGRRPGDDGPGHGRRPTTRCASGRHARPGVQRPARPDLDDRLRTAVREAMVGPLVGETRRHRRADHHQPARRGHQLRAGRPAPARDGRQPGRRRPRERPARAVAPRAVPPQGGAPPPGLPRLADRSAEPARLRRGGRAAASPRPSDGDAPPVVVFLDLDDFKIVNDTHGHAAGDELLVAVAERIGAQLRPGDLRRAVRRRRVRAAAGRRLDRRRRAGHDPADHRRARAAVPGPGHRRPRRLQRRDQRGPRRCAGRRGPAQRRRRDVSGQGRRQAPRAGLRPDHAQLDRRAARADLRPRPERQPGRPDRRLPADRRAGQRPRSSASRRSSAGTTRPAARSTRPSSSAWPRRTARSSRSAGRSSRRPPARSSSGTACPGLSSRSACRSTCRRSSSSTRASSTRSWPRSRRPGSTRAT